MPDPAVRPVRGQVVIAVNPGIEEFLVNQDEEPPWIVYMFPHGETVLLGGTNEEGAWDLEPEPSIAERIVAQCAAIDPRLRGATIVGHRVGLRPCRPQVRLESEPFGGGVLWHNYGHGGAGVSLAWGCAAEITENLLSWGTHPPGPPGRVSHPAERPGGPDLAFQGMKRSSAGPSAGLAAVTAAVAEVGETTGGQRWFDRRGRCVGRHGGWV